MGSRMSGSQRPSGRRLAAIMFTDMVGYSALTQNEESRAIELLGIQTRLIEPILVVHQGQLVKTMGDGLLVQFDSTTAACRAALDIQSSIRDHNKTAEERERFEIRIGIHLGDIEFVEGDVLGHGVNVASRIEPLAPAGGICVSEDVQRQIENSKEFGLVSMGSQTLKNISNPVKVFKMSDPSSSIRKEMDVSQNRAKSIAVIPFANLSPDPENEYFGDGLAEEILWSLAKIQTLRVVSRTSCFALKNHSSSVKEAGEILGVDYVLEGSVRRSGNRVRVAVQLVDISTDRPLWSDRYDRELDDIFEIQEDITARVVDTLQIALSEAERGAIGKVPTKNLKAYTEYLKGLGSFRIHAPTKELSQMLEATKLDPGFAKAHAMVGVLSLVLYRFYESTDKRHLDRAREAAKRALETDSEVVEAYLVTADLAEQDEKFDEAETAFKAAIKIDPNNYEAYYNYGRLMHVLGDPRAAAKHMLKAAETQPDDYQSAVLGAMRVLDVDGLETAKPYLAEALERVERRVIYEPDDARAYCLGSSLLAALGQIEKCHTFAEKAYKLAPESTGNLYNLACCFSRINECDKAINFLERSCDAGFGYSAWIRQDTDLKNILGDPRVDAILEKMDDRMADETA